MSDFAPTFCVDNSDSVVGGLAILKIGRQGKKYLWKSFGYLEFDMDGNEVDSRKKSLSRVSEMLVWCLDVKTRVGLNTEGGMYKAYLLRL